ncbi:MAG: ATP-dependent DNA helicase [Nitrospirae bacterium]|nr:ATP-dependent DNA helicase [Nitrospirota bacterium]
MLGAGGLLAARFPEFNPRPQQLEMARAVADAIEGGHHLLAEAGTGTGKTFAYLVPALLSGKRVVVSTGTRLLQDQVFGKDLVALERVLPNARNACVLKGRSNYLCLHRYAQVRAQGPGGLISRHDLEQLAAWAAETEVGDLAEVADLPETHPIWREVTVTAEQCLGGRCADFEACFITRAKRRAMRADLIVVNHHLLFADLGVKSGAFGEVLPHYDTVIFDEAHMVEEIATAFFGVRVSGFRIRDLATDVMRAVVALERDDAARVAADAQRVSDRSGPFFAHFGRGGADPEGGRVRFRPEALGPGFHPAAEGLEDAARLLAVALQSREDQSDELYQLARRAEALHADLALLLAPQSPDMIYWTEARKTGSAVGASPLHVGPLLNQHLYGRVKSAVFTSATLSTGGDMAYMRDRLGFRPAGVEAPPEDAATPRRAPVRDLLLGSPFDYPRQALLYLPDHLPAPKEPRFAEAVAWEIGELMAISGGRALLLFTSYRMMEEVYGRCLGRLPGRVLKQGEMPRHKLLEALVAEAPAILFATGSFWQGVDVPGEALSCVVIDKLPFAAPDDPVLAARVNALQQQGRNAFMEFQVPMAALALKQGVGRLIRGLDDRGVVAILDHRIRRMRYGQALLDSLPPMPRTAERADVAAFFGHSLAGAPERP